jgi:heterodisulfide reductase subunit A
VAEILRGPDENPVLVYEDTRERVVKDQEFDLVILATACVPSKGAPELAELLGIELNEFGFFKTDKANPVDTTRPGIYVCGCAHGPMDIPESVAQASGAAARAAQVAMVPEMRKAS